MGRVVVISVKVPREMIEEVDKLIRAGLFSSRSEAIRRAIAMLIKEYFDGLDERVVKR